MLRVPTDTASCVPRSLSEGSRQFALSVASHVYRGGKTQVRVTGWCSSPDCRTGGPEINRFRPQKAMRPNHNVNAMPTPKVNTCSVENNLMLPR